MSNIDKVPIITVSHNNYYYLKFMVDQIRGTYGAPKQLLVMDNQSTDVKTLEYLYELETKSDTIVIHNETNYGPRINHMNYPELYHSLPQQFVLTDPDIQFNPKLPANFIDIMYNISEHYRAEKVGFALDITRPDLLHDIRDYFMGKSIIEWELQFWQNPIEKLWDDKYPLYWAEIDTTFCLINKKYENSGRNIRIGGEYFLAKHLPWYKSNPVIDIEQQVEMARQQSADSTMSRFLQSSQSYTFSL